MFRQKWKLSSLPGGVQMSSRQIFDGELLIEEIILEATPLSLAPAESTQLYDIPVVRRRK